MLEIEKVNESNIEAVKLVRLADEQVKFAGTADEFLSSGNETTHLHIIKNDDVVVGFFKLDIAYSFNYEFCPPDGLGLRSFAIDIDSQGKGLGTKSVKVLLSYIKAYYSEFNWVYLTVNCKNPSAKACYENGGFENTPEQYLGGLAGPQHIMRVKIA
ncbi:GNAT family N-acetyltransferase [Vibrio parahaemolyticus]|nr:GNAT family N-acetyltransferase [Vibrio parahaemolyticus]EJG0909028.1 GNAT family N-acetyltransferase [Vibrio parahaemolyticus]